MSRVGKLPVEIVSGVEVKVAGNDVVVKGPKGELKQALVTEIKVAVETQPAKQVVVTRNGDSKRHRAMHGLYRNLIKNMILGVTKGYEKQLRIQGTGYRAEMKGKDLVLQAGFSHPVTVACPAGIIFEVPKAASRDFMDIIVRGCDKQMVGEMAARIRGVRPCDPYKAKGLRYIDEVVRRLEGKALGAG